MRIATALLVIAIGFVAAPPMRAANAVAVTEKINVLDLMKAGDVEFHINPQSDVHDAPEDVFKLKDGQLHISGRGYGYMATNQSFRDYHLVLEFKWGPKTWGKREDRARDNGILLHAYGPHGAYGGTWMASIEAQIIEGGIGDILVLSPKLADGTELITSVTAEIELDRDKEKVWKKGAPRQVVTKGRINWEKRDVDWADKINFRGKDDPDSPVGEWNRLEVIAKGDTLQYFVNGRLVNEAFECKPAEGRVLIQTEGAEMIARRYELYPLGAFKEKWNPIEASGGSDVPVRQGQESAMSPEKSLEQIRLDGDYEAQLVAHEPLVLDPVEVTWDEQGRMFVADMRDYPLGPEPGKPFLSRIQMLIDDNGDGRMDRAVTFADHIDHVQGLLPYNGGLIATTRTQILFLKDTDGDGKADENRPLIRGFNPRHSQLQVSSPRWGLDNCVHFNNGLDTREIYPADDPTKAVNVPGANFKWNPRTGAIEATGGKGQYGGAFDDHGHHFYCSNRNPLMFTVMPYPAMLRNPHAGITQNYEDIAPAGAETRVYPLKITHTTADAHAGTNTACCGLGVYRGPLMPELKNNVFVPDPTGQLITRYRVEPNGASLKATRVGERTEFFRSGDEWCRPVNFTTGPDGAIYVCDIYRRWIDHARFFPEEFVKANDMRQGENEGRIWRIVPKGKSAPKIAGAPAESRELAEWLNHPNAWQRETAQRLLFEKGQDVKAAALPEHPARQKFLALLEKKDLTDSDAAQLASAISAAPEDDWMARAVLAVSAEFTGHVLDVLARDKSFAGTRTAARSATFRSLASATAASGVKASFQHALQSFEVEPGKLSWWKPAVIQGLAEGLPKSGGKLGVKSLADLGTKPPLEWKATAHEVTALLAMADEIVGNRSAAIDQRLAVLPLLGQRKWEAVRPVVQQLLTGNEPAEITSAATVLLKRFPAATTAPLIYELLPKAGPALKRDLVPIITASPATALEFFKRMDKGEFPTAWVDVETRWRYQRGSGEMAELAKKLFGEAHSDRAAVVASYMDAATHPGDAKRGQQVFASICISCHKHGNLGVDVGPPLSDVKAKPPEALLSDILDPNRMFEARWSAYQIDTKDGRTLSGLIESETSDAIVIAMMGGLKETVQRSAIREMKSLDRSLMPPGLESAITKEQMADLLAFLGGN